MPGEFHGEFQSPKPSVPSAVCAVTLLATAAFTLFVGTMALAAPKPQHAAALSFAPTAGVRTTTQVPFLLSACSAVVKGGVKRAPQHGLVGINVLVRSGIEETATSRWRIVTQPRANCPLRVLAPGGSDTTPRILGRHLPLPPPPPLGASGQQLVAKDAAPRRPWAEGTRRSMGTKGARRKIFCPFYTPILSLNPTLTLTPAPLVLILPLPLARAPALALTPG